MRLTGMAVLLMSAVCSCTATISSAENLYSLQTASGIEADRGQGYGNFGMTRSFLMKINLISR